MYELGGSFFQFRTSQINSVSIFVTSTNTGNISTVYIDDSKGMPFAPGTAVDLNGNGPSFLNLYGSQVINGNELYVAEGRLDARPDSTGQCHVHAP